MFGLQNANSINNSMTNKQKIILLALVLIGNFTFLATAKNEPVYKNDATELNKIDTSVSTEKKTKSDNCRFECDFYKKH